MHVMIDIETLGTGRDAAIVQIGAVSFDLDQGVTAELAADIDLTDPQLGVIDADTVRFWLNQSNEARSAVLLTQSGRVPLKQALRWLANFVGGAGYVWAKPPQFDLRILRDAYARVGLDCPWPHYNERDLRTLLTVGKLMRAPKVRRTGVQHVAVDDARYQAEQALAVLRVIEGK